MPLKAKERHILSVSHQGWRAAWSRLSLRPQPFEHSIRKSLWAERGGICDAGLFPSLSPPPVSPGPSSVQACWWPFWELQRAGWRDSARATQGLVSTVYLPRAD